MSLVESVREIRKTITKKTSLEMLADLGFRFEMDTSIELEDLLEAVSFLVEWVVQEECQAIRDDIFSALYDAVFYRKIAGEVNWDPLAQGVAHEADGNLIWIFPLLGVSGDERYLGLLEDYRESRNVRVRQEARDAIEIIMRQKNS